MWRTKALLQKAEALKHARPSPAAMAGGEHIHFEHVAGLCALDPDRSGKRVNARAVNGEEFLQRGSGMHLAAARVCALDLHFVARLDAQPRLDRAVPYGVRRRRAQRMLSHGFTRTVI